MYFVQDMEGNQIYFDANEEYGSICPECKKEHMLVEGEFWTLMEGGSDLYGGGVYCQECSAARQEKRAAEGVVDFPQK